MKNRYKPLVTGILLVLVHFSLQGQDDAREIFTKATAQLLTENMQLKMELDIKDKRGRVKEKGFEVLVASFGDVEKTRMSWEKPVEAKGTTIIFTEHSGETGIIEVFTPSNGKIRKLKATPENMALIGSEAQMTNISAQDPDELTFSLLEPQEANGKKCFTIVAKDKNSTDNARGELLIEMDSYRIVQITVYNEKGNKSSLVKLSDYQPVDGPDNKIQAMLILTEDFESQKQTEMRVLEIFSRPDLKETDFLLPLEKCL
jgi:Outer membrane lipoprotein-sorting protein